MNEITVTTIVPLADASHIYVCAKRLVGEMTDPKAFEIGGEGKPTSVRLDHDLLIDLVALLEPWIDKELRTALRGPKLPSQGEESGPEVSISQEVDTRMSSLWDEFPKFDWKPEAHDE